MTRWRHLRDLVSTFLAIIIGKMAYRNPQWKRWTALTEAQFLDLPIASPSIPRLTFKLRQEAVPESMPLSAQSRARLVSSSERIVLLAFALVGGMSVLKGSRSRRGRRHRFLLAPEL